MNLTLTYAIVDLLGHHRRIGLLSEVEAYGGKLGMVTDIKSGQPYIFGAAAVYEIQPLADEEAAKKAAGIREPQPEPQLIDVAEPGTLRRAADEAFAALEAQRQQNEDELPLRLRESLLYELGRLGIRPSDDQLFHVDGNCVARIDDVELFLRNDGMIACYRGVRRLIRDLSHLGKLIADFGVAHPPVPPVHFEVSAYEPFEDD